MLMRTHATINLPMLLKAIAIKCERLSRLVLGNLGKEEARTGFDL